MPIETSSAITATSAVMQDEKRAISSRDWLRIHQAIERQHVVHRKGRMHGVLGPHAAAGRRGAWARARGCRAIGSQSDSSNRCRFIQLVIVE
jgi:hypothetical protein